MTPFEDFPVFTTDRLYLRMIQKSDVPALFRIKSDRELTSKYGIDPHTTTEQTATWVGSLLDDYNDQKTLFWCICLKGDDTPVGAFTLWNMQLGSLMAELGYELHRDYWRKGIMFEALSVLVDWAFTGMGLNRIEACPIKENTPSVRLLEKLGFKLEGTLRERIFFAGKFRDQLYYSMLRSEWNGFTENRVEIFFPKK